MSEAKGVSAQATNYLVKDRAPRGDGGVGRGTRLGAEKVRVCVKIFGEEYAIRSTAPPEYIEEIARYVDEKMRKVAETNEKLSISKVAVLAALNIADELCRLKAEHERSLRLVRTRARRGEGVAD